METTKPHRAQGWTMRHPFSAKLWALVLVVATGAAAAQPSEALSALPTNGFQFNGSWTCAGSFRSGKVHRANFAAQVVLAGKWLELTEQDVEPATGYVAKYLIGHDTQRKQLVEFDANNFGAAMYRSTDGWRSGMLTMTSPVLQEAGAAYAADRFLYTTLGKDSFTVDWQVSKTAVLSWIPADHLLCKCAAGV